MRQFRVTITEVPNEDPNDRLVFDYTGDAADLTGWLLTYARRMASIAVTEGRDKNRVVRDFTTALDLVRETP